MSGNINFLALCLLDAVEDENYNACEKLIKAYKASPNAIVIEREIAPIHYACGMENVELSEKIVKLMLDNGGDPNVRSKENMTPLHVAAIWGRSNVVRMLLEKGGDINAIDDENKTPILYAVYECQIEVVKTIQQFVFEQKLNSKKGTNLIISANIPNSTPPYENKILKEIDNKPPTPKKVYYNFDKASPYYINITHRKKPGAIIPTFPKSSPDNAQEIDGNSNNKISASRSWQTEQRENLFKLTEENVSEYSKEMSSNELKISFIRKWQEKVQNSRNRRSLINHFKDIDSLLSMVMTEENVNFTNTSLDLDGKNAEMDGDKKTQKPFTFTGFGKLLQTLKAPDNAPISEDSFRTAENNLNGTQQRNESHFIRSPKQEDYVVQLTEEYEHKDEENGIIFYERKIRANTGSPRINSCAASEANKSIKSCSTRTLPLDYDTDALRAELTHFGEPPGPITKSTKKLYMKRLMKYKKSNTNHIVVNKSGENQVHPSFSVEVEKTLRKPEWFAAEIPNFIQLEKVLSQDFQHMNDLKKAKLREGHLKMSFLYLLIDPRISDNLPGQSPYIESHDIWRRFINSIFYVGKGKNVRPYSHLYDAMKLFWKTKSLFLEEENFETLNESKDAFKYPSNEKDTRSNYEKIKTVMSVKSPTKQSNESKKLERILDIWLSGKGVVCLHVFHNILPVEAYTREAAIIDALSLKHLTNLKRGDYYGCVKTWDMRKRKCMGIGLLFKAMQIYLAEGESQLMPCDLI